MLFLNLFLLAVILFSRIFAPCVKFTRLLSHGMMPVCCLVCNACFKNVFLKHKCNICLNML